MKPLVLFARAVAVLTASRLFVARRGTTATLRRLSMVRRTGRRLEPTQALEAVRRAGRVVGGACLEQSVALTVLLKRHGEEPALILGCSRVADGSWTAHAWVELREDVLEPVKANRHAVLARLDASNGWTPLAPAV